MSIHEQVAALIASGKMTGLNALDEARKLEDEVDRRRLWLRYISRLIDIVNEADWDRPEEYRLGYTFDNGVPHLFGGNVWGMAALLQATPRQRARAFLEAIR